MGEVCMIMRQHSHQFSFNNTKTFGSGFRFSVIYRRVCFILVVTQHNQFRLQHLEIGKKKKSLLGYVLLTHSNARTQRLSSLQIWKDRGWGWNEEGKSDLFFIAELGRCLSKLDWEMSLCAWAHESVWALVGREKRSALCGGKHPPRGPAFQLCDSFSPHKCSRTHACHFQGQIPPQAWRIKSNGLTGLHC